VDYPLPFRINEGSPAALDGKLSVESNDRPLVHVFLIQESMQLEAIQLVTESLISAIESMHPDVYIAIVGFSHRLCVYRLNHDELDATHNKSVCIPFVNSNAVSDTGVYEFDDLIPEVTIASQIDFFEAAAPVGVCRELAISILRSLLHNYVHGTYNHIEDDGNREAAVRNEDQRAVDIKSEDDDRDDLKNFNIFPEVMLGPALESTHDWFVNTKNYHRNTNKTDKTNGSGSGSGSVSDRDSDGDSNDENFGEFSSNGFVSNVFNVVRRIARGFVSDLYNDNNGKSRPSAAETGDSTRGHDHQEQRVLSAASRCSGIVLHLFVSSPQDLPEGAHASVAASPATESLEETEKRYEERERDIFQQKRAFYESSKPGLDKKWSAELGMKFVQQGIQANVWGICWQNSQRIGLAALSPLAQMTGGSTSKTTLGAQALTAARFTEELQRALASCQLATKCIMKLRASPIIDIAPEGITGHLTEDKDLPDVYRIAGCYDTFTFGARISYKNSDASLNPAQRDNKIALQMAFSYETMVEDLQTEKGREEMQKCVKVEEENSGLSSGSYFKLACSLLGLGTELEGTRSCKTAEELRHAEIRGKRSTREKGRIVTSDRTRHGASKDGDSSCVYDKKRRLRVVRRLRVFTLVIQCTHRVPRLIQCRKFIITAIILSRLACVQMAKQSFDEVGREAQNGAVMGSASALTMLESWAVAFLGSQASTLRAMHSSIEGAVEDSLGQNSTRRLLAMLCGAIQNLSLHSLMNPKSATENFSQKRKLPGAGAAANMRAVQRNDPSSSSLLGREITPRLSVSETDSIVVLHSILQTTDAYNSHKIIYPTCNALTENGRVLLNEILPLSREAMVINGASAFIINSGLEFILFRQSHLSWMNARTQSTQLNNGIGADTSKVNDSTETRAPEIRAKPSVGLHAECPPIAVGQLESTKALNIPKIIENQRKDTTSKVDQCAPLVFDDELQDKSTSTDGLSSDPDWLPNVIKRQLEVCTIVPLFLESYAGTSSSVHMYSKLVDDSEESMDVSSFIANIKRMADDLLKP